jgi:hypothetical protein
MLQSLQFHCRHRHLRPLCPRQPHRQEDVVLRSPRTTCASTALAPRRRSSSACPAYPKQTAITLYHSLTHADIQAPATRNRNYLSQTMMVQVSLNVPRFLIYPALLVRSRPNLRTLRHHLTCIVTIASWPSLGARWRPFRFARAEATPLQLPRAA